MSKRIIYVAHPYGGEKMNSIKVERIMRELMLGCDAFIYFSPIQNFGVVYNEVSYKKGLDMCLEMLSKSNALILCEDWQNSKRCIGEYAYAKAMGISTYSLDEWKEYVTKNGWGNYE